MATARIIVVAIDGAIPDRLTLPKFAQLSADAARTTVDGAMPEGHELCAAVSAAGRRVRRVDLACANGATVTADELVVGQGQQLAELVALVDERQCDLVWVECRGLAVANVIDGHADGAGARDTQLRIGRVIDEGLTEVVKRLDEATGLLVLARGRAGAPTSSASTLGGIGAEVYAFVRALRRSSLGWLPKLMPQRLMATASVPAAKPASAEDGAMPATFGAPEAEVHNESCLLFVGAAARVMRLATLDGRDLTATVLRLIDRLQPSDLRDAAAGRVDPTVQEEVSHP